MTPYIYQIPWTEQIKKDNNLIYKTKPIIAPSEETYIRLDEKVTVFRLPIIFQSPVSNQTTMCAPPRPPPYAHIHHTLPQTHIYAFLKGTSISHIQCSTLMRYSSVPSTTIRLDSTSSSDLFAADWMTMNSPFRQSLMKMHTFYNIYDIGVEVHPTNSTMSKVNWF